MAKNIDSNNFFNYFNIDVSKNTLTLINDLIIGNNLTWNNPINCDSLDKLNSTGLSNNNLIIDGNNKTITINEDTIIFTGLFSGSKTTTFKNFKIIVNGNFKDANVFIATNSWCTELITNNYTLTINNCNVIVNGFVQSAFIGTNVGETTNIDINNCYTIINSNISNINNKIKFAFIGDNFGIYSKKLNGPNNFTSISSIKFNISNCYTIINSRVNTIFGSNIGAGIGDVKFQNFYCFVNDYDKSINDCRYLDNFGTTNFGVHLHEPSKFTLKNIYFIYNNCGTSNNNCYNGNCLGTNGNNTWRNGIIIVEPDEGIYYGGDGGDSNNNIIKMSEFFNMVDSSSEAYTRVMNNPIKPKVTCALENFNKNFLLINKKNYILPGTNNSLNIDVTTYNKLSYLNYIIKNSDFNIGSFQTGRNSSFNNLFTETTDISNNKILQLKNDVIIDDSNLWECLNLSLYNIIDGNNKLITINTSTNSTIIDKDSNANTNLFTGLFKLNKSVIFKNFKLIVNSNVIYTLLSGGFAGQLLVDNCSVIINGYAKYSLIPNNAVYGEFKLINSYTIINGSADCAIGGDHIGCNNNSRPYDPMFSMTNCYSIINGKANYIVADAAGLVNVGSWYKSQKITDCYFIINTSEVINIDTGFAPVLVPGSNPKPLLLLYYTNAKPTSNVTPLPIKDFNNPLNNPLNNYKNTYTIKYNNILYTLPGLTSSFNIDLSSSSQISYPPSIPTIGTKIYIGSIISNTNFNDVKFDDSNFFNSNFNGSILTNTSFTNSNLSYSNLINVDLTRANLQGANLTCVNLTNANLCNANLCNVDLCNANLCNANLCYANLSNANLSNADLSNANLSDANLSNANLTGAKLINTNLTLAKLTNTNLTNANLTSTDLTEATLECNILKNTTLNETNLSNTQILKIPTDSLKNLISKNIIGQPKFDSLSIKVANGYLIGPGVNLSNANLININFENIDLRDSNLSKSNLSNAKFIGTELGNTDLTYAVLNNITSSNITTTPIFSTSYKIYNKFIVGPNVNLSNCDLSYINTLPKDLSDTDLSGANLCSANLSNNNLSNTKLNNTNLTDVKFTSVRSGGISGIPKLSEEYKLINGYIIGPSINLMGANLSNATISNLNLTGLNMDDTNLENSTICETILSNCTFNNSVLSNTTLVNNIIDDTDFSNSKFTNLRTFNLTFTNSPKLPPNYVMNKDCIFGPSVNLSGFNLSNLKFSDVNLNGSNFSECNLSDTIFNISSNSSINNLSNVNFTNSNLTNCVCSNVNLSNAIFNSTILKNTSFKNITSYSSIVLPIDYKIINSKMFGPELNLLNIDLTNIDLTNTNLKNANLSEATFKNTVITGCNLSNTNLTNIKINEPNTSITSGKIIGIPILPSNYTLYNGFLIGSNINLKDADLSYFDIDSSNLSKNGKYDLSNINFTNCNLSYADFTDTKLSNCNFTDSKLISADFSKCDIYNVILKNANLTNTIFSNSELTKINLQKSIIVNTLFNDATLKDITYV